MKLSIIIVNYQSSLHIVNCIKSAIQFFSAYTFEWIIVDNASTDNSKAIITQQFPFVQWIQMSYNAGFSRANNEGIRSAKGEIVLLLNPDTLILDNAIEKCFKKFIHTDYVACSVQLLNTDLTPQITGNYFMKGGLNHLLPLPYLGNFLRKIAFAMKIKKTNVVKASIEEKVDWINGAFLMVKKQVIAKAGMLDEDFFLYAEETEWCSRLKKFGELCVYGEFQIIHLQGESINKATRTSDKGYSNFFNKKGLQLMVSQLVFVRKQFGKAWFIFHVMVNTVEIPIFFICSFFDNLFHLKSPFSDLKKIKGYASNVRKLWKLSPTILGNKPYFYKML